MDYIKKFYVCGVKGQTRSAAICLALFTLKGLTEVVGVSSIIPFVSVLVDESAQDSNLVLAGLWSLGWFNTRDALVIFTGMLSLGLLTFSLSIGAFATYYQLRYVYAREAYLTRKMLERYLQREMEWKLQATNADMSKNILSETSVFVSRGLLSGFSVISNTITICMMVFVAFILDPRLTIAAGSFVLCAYLIIVSISSRVLSKMGSTRLRANEQRFDMVDSFLRLLPEIFVLNKQTDAVTQFQKPVDQFQQSTTIASIVERLPRYAVEAVTFGGLILLAIIMLSGDDSMAKGLPVIAGFAFAVYRIVPAVQGGFASWSKLKFVGPTVDLLYANLIPVRRDANRAVRLLDQDSDDRHVVFEGVNYSYPREARGGLTAVNLVIHKGKRIGLMGESGSGKTTLLYCAAGLLSPTSGVISFARSRQLGKVGRLSTAYVPQQVQLFDGDVYENISLGFGRECDNDRVHYCCEKVGLTSLIRDGFLTGFETSLGDQGNRLSAGQRQRFGIARALYHNPEFLVLDEVTSNLDARTAELILDVIFGLFPDKTVLLAAHQKSNLSRCDEIIELRGGRMLRKGAPSLMLE